MKPIFIFVTSFIIFSSCGKYEKPFLTLSSPEKRLTNETWVLDRFVRTDGSEGNSNETYEFKINGSDSVYTRTIDGISYTGTWSWRPAEKNKWDKQKIIVNIDIPSYTLDRIVYEVKVLTGKELEIIDMNGSATANFRYFLKN